MRAHRAAFVAGICDPEKSDNLGLWGSPFPTAAGVSSDPGSYRAQASMVLRGHLTGTLARLIRIQGYNAVLSGRGPIRFQKTRCALPAVRLNT